MDLSTIFVDHVWIQEVHTYGFIGGHVLGLCGVQAVARQKRESGELCGRRPSLSSGVGKGTLTSFTLYAFVLP